MALIKLGVFVFLVIYAVPALWIYLADSVTLERERAEMPPEGDER